MSVCVWLGILPAWCHHDDSTTAYNYTTAYYPTWLHICVWLRMDMLHLPVPTSLRDCMIVCAGFHVFGCADFATQTILNTVQMVNLFIGAWDPVVADKSALNVVSKFIHEAMKLGQYIFVAYSTVLVPVNRECWTCVGCITMLFWYILIPCCGWNVYVYPQCQEEGCIGV